MITPAFRLQERGVRFVIHAVGPIWRGGTQNEDGLLAGAYRRAMELADEAGCRSVAFPSVSTGVYGFPVERAAPIALETARKFLAAHPAELQRVIFALFDGDTFRVFDETLKQLA